MLLLGFTAIEMIAYLENLKIEISQQARNRRMVNNTKPQALIVMIISHGCDEKILGYNLCNAINGEVVEDHNDLDLQSDHVDIANIVDMFSDTNFPIMKDLPKLFFFTCCREKGDLQLHKNELDRIDANSANKDTFVCYSCAEGYKTFYDPAHQISYFGQALSHSIAQYANRSDLNSIIGKTTNALLEMYDSSDFASEIRSKGLRRKIYFNPKWSE